MATRNTSTDEYLAQLLAIERNVEQEKMTEKKRKAEQEKARLAQIRAALTLDDTNNSAYSPQTIRIGASFTDDNGIDHYSACGWLAIETGLKLLSFSGALGTFKYIGFKAAVDRSDFTASRLKQLNNVNETCDRIGRKDIKALEKYLGVAIIVIEGEHLGHKGMLAEEVRAKENNRPIIFMYLYKEHYAIIVNSTLRNYYPDDVATRFAKRYGMDMCDHRRKRINEFRKPTGDPDIVVDPQQLLIYTTSRAENMRKSAARGETDPASFMAGSAAIRRDENRPNHRSVRPRLNTNRCAITPREVSKNTARDQTRPKTSLTEKEEDDLRSLQSSLNLSDEDIAMMRQDAIAEKRRMEAEEERKRMEEADETYARRLYEEEKEDSDESWSSSYEDNIDSAEEDTANDADYARILQKEEESNTTQAPTASVQSHRVLSHEEMDRIQFEYEQKVMEEMRQYML